MTPTRSDQGRAGDIWRVEAAGYEATVEKITKYWIAVNSGQPAGQGPAYPFAEWNDVLQRISEEVDSLHVGDVAHVYIPTTDIYLIDVKADDQRPFGMAWFAWRVGDLPTPEVEDSGLYFDPGEEPNLIAELRHRPYSMLRSGDRLTDATGAEWEYLPPFRFVATDGQFGVPTWPLKIPGEPDRTTELNNTSHSEELAMWGKHARVSAAVFDLDWPTF